MALSELVIAAKDGLLSTITGGLKYFITPTGANAPGVIPLDGATGLPISPATAAGQAAQLTALGSPLQAGGNVAVTSLPALPSGANAIGSVTANAGTNLNTSALALEAGGNLAAILAKLIAAPATAANQSTEITALNQLHTDMIAATPAGSNIIGYAGSLNFQSGPITPTIQAAAYAAGNCLGALQTVGVFRNVAQASATLAQMMLCWLGGETVAVTVYLFSRNPTNSTIVDRSAFVLSPIDAKYLVTSPFVLSPSAVVGTTTTFVTQPLSLPAKNQDATTSLSLYVVFVVGSAVTPAVGDLVFSLSGVQD